MMLTAQQLGVALLAALAAAACVAAGVLALAGLATLPAIRLGQVSALLLLLVGGLCLAWLG